MPRCCTRLSTLGTLLEVDKRMQHRGYSPSGMPARSRDSQARVFLHVLVPKYSMYGPMHSAPRTTSSVTWVWHCWRRAAFSSTQLQPFVRHLSAVGAKTVESGAAAQAAVVATKRSVGARMLEAYGDSFVRYNADVQRLPLTLLAAALSTACGSSSEQCWYSSFDFRKGGTVETYEELDRYRGSCVVVAGPVRV